MRGDWFIATALRYPLYNELMHRGESLDEIVRRELGVDINENIAQGRVQRIARLESGAWSSYALFERHAVGRGGYLWLRYALAQSEDVRRNPLGPRDRNGDFPNRFSTASTEAIWSLPNGLQGYAQAAANGDLLADAPVTISRIPEARVERWKPRPPATGATASTA